MRAWHILRSRLRSAVFRGRRESDLNEELQLHLELETERLQASGLSREDARLQALRLFGGVEQIKEASGDERGTALIDNTIRRARTSRRCEGTHRCSPTPMRPCPTSGFASTDE